jgi:hypothetical protein
MPAQLAWGKKVSAAFRARVRMLAADLLMDHEGPSKLMSCMAFETNETFAANIKNAAGSGAVGLIQFMPATARHLGTTVEELEKLTPEDQLHYVRLYFNPYRGRLRTLSDVYMAILWPAAIGKPDDYVLFAQSSRPVTYRQNLGLDINRDTVITKAEAAAKVELKMVKGLSPALSV